MNKLKNKKTYWLSEVKMGKMTGRVILMAMMLMICNGTVRAQQTVTLAGVIKNGGKYIRVEDFSEFSPLERPSVAKTIVTDTQGKFSITFNLDAPNYFRIGRNKLYLTPGDSLDCTIDSRNAELAKFEGKGSDACNYLTDTPFPKAGSYLNASKNIYQSPLTTMDSIISQAVHRKMRLNQLTGVTEEFKRLETARISADVRISLAGLNTYLRFFNAYARKFNADYSATILAVAVPVIENYSLPLDASLLKVEPYRDLASTLVDNDPKSKEAGKIRDWMKVTALVSEMNSSGEKDKLADIENNLKTVKTESYRLAGEKYLDNVKNYGKGDVAEEISCVDDNLRRVALSALRGKVIYIDLWATWCGPCIAEMPAYEALKLKYKDNPNVVFVSISIDDESAIKEWQKNITARKAGGYQWEVNRNRLAAYNVTGIPRAIIIDKNFRIADMNAPLPSGKNLPAQLDELLKM